MSEPENFLERWSRRKREADDASLPSPATSKEEKNAREESGEKGPPSGASPCEPAPFDVSTLPPIESIGADSDVRAFMQPGVPLDLRHAALRRAWSADPEIRDFIGLVENGWDFNDPNGVAGFGPLPEGVDIKSLLAQAIGTPQPDTSQPAVASGGLPDPQTSPEQNCQMPIETAAASLSAANSAMEQSNSAPSKEVLQCNEDRIATQNDSNESHSVRRRGHGGALPK